MNTWLAQLFGGDLLTGVKDIINALHLDPAKQAEITELLEQHKADLALKQLDLEAKAMEIQENEVTQASENIRAEAQSGDKFTSRARPTFMYMVIFILGFNYVFIPLAKIFAHNSMDPIQLPTNLLALFGVCVTGYVGARSLEKIMGMDGDSQVSFLGLSVKQNSTPVNK